MGRILTRVFSVFLLLAGLYFVYLGVREYRTTFSAQEELAHAWKNVHIPPAPVELPRELPGETTAPAPESAGRTAPGRPQLRSQPRLRLGDPVAELIVPRLDKKLFVIEGTDLRDLKRAPGHMQGTALPGQNGNCVIAGHRDTHFRFLKDIRIGDEIVLQTREGTFRYRVRGTSIVFPANTACLRNTAKPVLHLITCYPFYYVGSAPKRFIVQADLETAPERQQIAD